MTSFLAWLNSFFEEKESSNDPRIRVCWLFLGFMLGDMLDFTDEEDIELMKIDDRDPDILREFIREFVVPHYRYYSPENQKKIRDTLTYYLATDSSVLDWPFAALHINLETPGKLFYTLVWQELYGTDGPDPINPADYVEDCSVNYINSLLIKRELKEKYNPEGKKPGLANVLARIAARKASQYDNPQVHALHQQCPRAPYGRTPEGLRLYPTDSSRWFREIDIFDGYQVAYKQWQDAYPSTGESLYISVKFDKNIGEGYLKKSHKLIKTNLALFRFDENGDLIVAYPLLRRKSRS